MKETMGYIVIGGIGGVAVLVIIIACIYYFFIKEEKEVNAEHDKNDNQKSIRKLQTKDELVVINNKKNPKKEININNQRYQTKNVDIINNKRKNTDNSNNNSFNVKDITLNTLLNNNSKQPLIYKINITEKNQNKKIKIQDMSSKPLHQENKKEHETYINENKEDNVVKEQNINVIINNKEDNNNINNNKNNDLARYIAMIKEKKFFKNFENFHNLLVEIDNKFPLNNEENIQLILSPVLSACVEEIGKDKSFVLYVFSELAKNENLKKNPNKFLLSYARSLWPYQERKQIEEFFNGSIIRLKNEILKYQQEIKNKKDELEEEKYDFFYNKMPSVLGMPPGLERNTKLIHIGKQEREILEQIEEIQKDEQNLIKKLDQEIDNRDNMTQNRVEDILFDIGIKEFADENQEIRKTILDPDTAITLQQYDHFPISTIKSKVNKDTLKNLNDWLTAIKKDKKINNCDDMLLSFKQIEGEPEGIVKPCLIKA